MRKMTDEEKDYFISAAQIGMACGLSHPWEWLYNVLRMSWMPYDQREIMEQRYINAFVAFWNGCGGHPNDPCETATAEDLIKEIERWYTRPLHAKE